MAENETSVAQAADEASAFADRDLYDEEIERYRATLNRDLDVAFRRYGFTLYHSLEGGESVELRKKIGLKPGEPTDFYNLGVIAAQKGELSAAAGHFRKALELDPGLDEAEFNLALALERSGDRAGARKQWSAYLKRPDIAESERTSASGHLAELG